MQTEAEAKVLEAHALGLQDAKEKYGESYTHSIESTGPSQNHNYN